MTSSAWMISFILLCSVVWIFNPEIYAMVVKWGALSEYSYGYLLPVVVPFLIWQKQNILARHEFDGSWLGVIIICLGAIVFLLGKISTLQVIIQYAFLIVVYGVVLSFVGVRAFKVILVPLLMLAFMIPLPQFLFSQLSSSFQLLSSEIGVSVLKALGVSVYLEGNVIDLGTYKLQVIDACSGLRYLFPLLVFGFILTYFYKARLWKRILVIFSAIPVTIIMNSLRIALIGVTVDQWGEQMAEGVLHDFEGWVVFMLSSVILVAEMWLLNMIGAEKRPFTQVFGITIPKSIPKDLPVKQRNIPGTFIAAAVGVVVIAVLSATIDKREEIIPARQSFTTFPLVVGSWQGRSERMERLYVDALKFTDYVLNNYVDQNDKVINFYSAYYDSQRSGESAHSPRSCIPGGGWKISSLTDVPVSGVNISGRPLHVNRAIIEKDDVRQVVYYWFQQRGRVITNEYATKWYLFWDALTRNRTDGALVRVTSPVGIDDHVENADKRLIDFIRQVVPELDAYIPS